LIVCLRGAWESRVGRRAVVSASVIALAMRTGVLVAAPLAAQTLAVTADPARSEILAELGPLHIAPGSSGDVGEAGMSMAPALVGVLPVDGWLRGYRVELVDAAGRPLPRTMIHHVNLIAPERRELFSNIMLRIGAAGSETDPVVLPRVFGYRVARGDSLLVLAMLHNPTPRAYDGVRLRVRFDYVAADTRLRPVSVYPFYLDVTPPAGEHAYDLKPGRSEQSWEGRPAIDGRIIGVGGHLHRYAVALRFEDMTTGDLLWEAKPETSPSGDVVGMPRKIFYWQLGLPVHPAHRYRLTAIYDNPTGATIPDGAMGTLGGIVRPSDPSRWPRLDRGAPEYREDLRVTYAMDDASMDMHDGLQDDRHLTMHDGMGQGTVRTGRTAESP